MRYLCIDTSTGASVCVVDYDGENFNILAHVFISESNLHAEKLSLLVKEVLQECGVKTIFDLNINYVLCGTGPAPFTGLRAGLVTARTIAFTLGVPILGICSLDILALQGFDYFINEKNVFNTFVNNNLNNSKGFSTEKLLVVTDAKRKEVYYGLYELNGKDDVRLIGDVGVDFPKEVHSKIYSIESINDLNIKNVGNACVKYSDYFEKYGDIPLEVKSYFMARIAYFRLLNGIEMNNVEPKYLRRPDVQEPKTK